MRLGSVREVQPAAIRVWKVLTPGGERLRPDTNDRIWGAWLLDGSSQQFQEGHRVLCVAAVFGRPLLLTCYRC